MDYLIYSFVTHLAAVFLKRKWQNTNIFQEPY